MRCSSKAIATMLVLLVLGFVPRASADAIADTFYTNQSQWWTGWVDYSGGAPVKHNDTIVWRDSDLRGWGYFNISNRHKPVDSVAICYDQFFYISGGSHELHAVFGVDPVNRQAQDLWSDLAGGYSLGTESDAITWHRHSCPATTTWLGEDVPVSVE